MRWRKTGIYPDTHLAFLPTHEGEVSLTLLVAPASPGQGVADDDVGVAAAVETWVEVQCDVLRVMTDVDGKAATEAGGVEVKRVQRNRKKPMKH